MGIFTRLPSSEKGYGEADARLSRALLSAKSKDEADTAARDSGLEDAEDAAAWLRDRS